jgi:hypothetical protein
MKIQTKHLKDIANWMKPENPSELPEILQGIFFMDGNVLADYCLTMSGGKWNSDDLTLTLPVFAPMVWSFHDSDEGKNLLDSVVENRLIYVIQFTDRTLYHARITPIWADVPVPPSKMVFFMDIDENEPNGDIWYRTNSFNGNPPEKGYVLRRIADGKGNYLPAFENMLAKVDKDCLIISS